MLAEGASPHGQIDPSPSHPRRNPPSPPSDDIAAPIPESELAAIAQETSQTERRAAEAERELIEWKKIKFMRDRVGEDFDAMILNATKYGLFVELDNLFVEGLVPIDSLRDDHYTYRENTREIIGSRNRRIYFMGQRVRVVLDRIDSIQKRLQFSVIAEDVSPQSPSHKAKSKRKEKEKKFISPAARNGKASASSAKGHKTSNSYGNKRSVRKRQIPSTPARSVFHVLVVTGRQQKICSHSCRTADRSGSWLMKCRWNFWISLGRQHSAP